MSDLRQLYQEVILDHGRRPRNFTEMINPTYSQVGHNPLCGDKLILYISEKNNCIEKINFTGNGCAISMASASLMTEVLQGKTLIEAMNLFDGFHQALTGESSSKLENLGKLKVLAGVSEFPARVKCATLAWQTLKFMLEKKSGLVSTE